MLVKPKNEVFTRRRTKAAKPHQISSSGHSGEDVHCLRDHSQRGVRLRFFSHSVLAWRLLWITTIFPNSKVFELTVLLNENQTFISVAYFEIHIKVFSIHLFLFFFYFPALLRLVSVAVKSNTLFWPYLNCFSLTLWLLFSSLLFFAFQSLVYSSRRGRWCLFSH